MSKKLLLIAGFFVLFGAAVGYLLLKPDKLTVPQSEPVPVSINTPANPSTAGVYVAYSAATLAEAKDQKVLFFHAPWCPQCRSIESGINAQGVPTGLTILKVDYDTNQALRQKYGVTIQTTFVKIDDQNNFVSKYVAYHEPTFDAVKKNFL